METERRDFLINRDGVLGAIKFYRQAIKCYGVASEVALKDGKGAKGREWSAKYKDAESECTGLLNSLLTMRNCAFMDDDGKYPKSKILNLPNF